MSLDRAAARDLTRRPDLARLLAVLDGDGEETRIVGGAVRDALLGRPVKEIDLATTALPKDISSRSAAAGLRTIPTGIAHGTVTVLVGDRPFEVTTLREDVETDGRHAVVRFGRDFTADATRRDFTVNALSLDRAGEVRDNVGGLDDLAAGRIRFIGEPRRRIREDYLRTLRFFRFTAEIAADGIDAEGLDAAIRERDGLARLSRERVGAELLRFVTARRVVPVAAILSQSGLLGRLIASVPEPGRLARAAAADSGAPDPIVRLGAWLVRTREDAERLAGEMRLSNAARDRLAAHAGALARLTSRAGPVDPPELRRFVVLHGLDATRSALAVAAGEPHVALDGEAARLLAGYATGAAALPRFPLTGADLVREGVPPGPEIGRRLAAARAAWVAGGCREG